MHRRRGRLSVAVFIVWAAAGIDEELPGPWSSIRCAGPGLFLLDSQDTLSRVYHELKWSLPDGASLLVVPAAARPKFRGLRPGTLTWLRAASGP